MGACENRAWIGHYAPWTDPNPDTGTETLDMDRFANIGVIRNEAVFDEAKLAHFLATIDDIRAQATWSKAPIVDLFNHMIPEFAHKETGKYLDGRM